MGVCIMYLAQELASFLSFKEILVVGIILIAVIFGGLSNGQKRETANNRPLTFKGFGSRVELERSSSFAKSYENLKYLRRPASLELGKIGLVPYRLLGRDSSIVFGPTQSFKTSRLVIPAVSNFQGGVIASSVKDDLLVETLNSRSSLGPVTIFDPLGVSDMGNSYFNPLERPLSDLDARRISEIICSTESTMAATEETRFWNSLAAKLLQPLVLAASHMGGSLSEVVKWVDERDFTNAGEFLANNDFEVQRRSLGASIDREERQLSSVITTLEKCLHPFRVGSEFEVGFQNLAYYAPSLDSTLYLISPPNRQREIGPVFGAVLTGIFDHIYSDPGRGHHKLLIALDEAANIAPIPNLDEIVSTIAAFGVTIMTIFQDVAQVRARYGERGATLINNHRAKVFLGAISDPETLNLAELLCGMNYNQPSGFRRRQIEQTFERQLLRRGGLRALPPGKALVVYGHRNPAVVRLNRS